MEGSPLVLLDEPELGLEPYRQRRLAAEIRDAIGEHGQAFLTTHSPAILGALETGEVSRVVPGTDPVGLDGTHFGWIQKEAPDALLSRLPILVEGITEGGLLAPLLNDFAERDELPDIDALGIRLLARGGQPRVLEEAEQFLQAGLACGLFVDNETTHIGRRAALARNPRCAFATWDGVRNIEEAVAAWLSWDGLPRVVELAAKLRSRPETDLLQQVGGCIGKPGTATLEDLRNQFGENPVRVAVAAAMQAKHNPWFKTLQRGEALGELLLKLGMPRPIEEVLHAFWHRVRQESGWV